MTGPSTQTLRITVAIFRPTENESQKTKTKEGVREWEREGDRKELEKGVGKACQAQGRS